MQLYLSQHRPFLTPRTRSSVAVHAHFSSFLFLPPAPPSSSVIHPAFVRERDWTSLFHVVRIATVVTPIESGQLTFAIGVLNCRPHAPTTASPLLPGRSPSSENQRSVAPVRGGSRSERGGRGRMRRGTRAGERGCGSDDRQQHINFHRCHVLSTAASIHPSSFPAAPPHTSSSSKRSAAGSNSSSRHLRQDAPRSRFAQTTHACLGPHRTHKGRQQTAQKREREWRRQQSPASEHTHTHTTRTIRSSFFCGGASRR